MLYDRIYIDNKEVGRKIWKICTTLNDLWYVEWFVLRWKIWTTFNGLYSVELFVQRWIICSTALNDLYYVEWFVQRLKVFYFVAKFVPSRTTCTAKELYSVERFVLRWVIRSAMDDLYNVGSFGLRLIIGYRLFNGRAISTDWTFSKFWTD